RRVHERVLRVGSRNDEVARIDERKAEGQQMLKAPARAFAVRQNEVSTKLPELVSGKNAVKIHISALKRDFERSSGGPPILPQAHLCGVHGEGRREYDDQRRSSGNPHVVASE